MTAEFQGKQWSNDVATYMRWKDLAKGALCKKGRKNALETLETIRAHMARRYGESAVNNI
jgi:hypothetical protein